MPTLLLALLALYVFAVLAFAAAEVFLLARVQRRGIDCPGVAYPPHWRPLGRLAAVAHVVRVRWRLLLIDLVDLVPGAVWAIGGAWGRAALVWLPLVAGAAMAAFLGVDGTARLVLMVGMVGLAIWLDRGAAPAAKARAVRGDLARDDARLRVRLGTPPACARCTTRAAEAWGLCGTCRDALAPLAVDPSDERVWGDPSGNPLPLPDGEPVIWGTSVGEAIPLEPGAYNAAVADARQQADDAGEPQARGRHAWWDPARPGACWVAAETPGRAQLTLVGFQAERLRSVFRVWVGVAPTD